MEIDIWPAVFFFETELKVMLHIGTLLEQFDGPVLFGFFSLCIQSVRHLVICIM